MAGVSSQLHVARTADIIIVGNFLKKMQVDADHSIILAALVGGLQLVGCCSFRCKTGVITVWAMDESLLSGSL